MRKSCSEFKQIKLNKEYQKNRLEKVDPDPFIQFDQWFNEANQAMPTNLVNSMALATVSSDHKPSIRMVLLKEYNSQGFIFYTNYQSQKGLDIANNPAVSLLFWWEPLERQIRIEGQTEKISAQQSEIYFHSRFKSSQIAACVSQQSEILSDVNQFYAHYQTLLAEYADENKIIPCPNHWGGYIVKPQRFEYWQGRENRLHDRFQYNLNIAEKWEVVRLFP